MSFAQIYDNITKYMLTMLDGKRMHHCLGVAHTALHLAQMNKVDIEKTVLAALLHDIAKQMPATELTELCNQAPFLGGYAEYFTEFPGLQHGPASSTIAMRLFNICDPEVLNAISFHSTGYPNPGKLLKIIMIADYIEPSRKRIATNIKQLSLRNLDESFFTMLNQKADYLHNIKQVPVNKLMLLTLESILPKQTV